jgi:hypothetical protein
MATKATCSSTLLQRSVSVCRCVGVSDGGVDPCLLLPMLMLVFPMYVPWLMIMPVPVLITVRVRRSATAETLEPYLLHLGANGAVLHAWTGVRDENTAQFDAVLTDVYVVSETRWIVAGYAKPETGACASLLVQVNVTIENGTIAAIAPADTILQPRGDLCSVASVALSPNRQYAEVYPPGLHTQ